MVNRLVSRVLECPDVSRIILTHNIPEEATYCGHPRVHIIANALPKGFGANHNASFRQCREPFFCVLNPDIAFDDDPFPGLLRCQRETGASVVGPLILNPEGTVEDSIRHFPTVANLGRKLIGGPDGRYPVEFGQPALFPDWIAGMFMLFSAPDFARLEGFDERYFLYYEDVDICRRAWAAGMKVAACPSTVAIHDARRSSHRNLRHLRWHLASMLRYLWQYR